MSPTLQPLLATNRDRSLDILRGFALAGVLFIFCVSDIGPANNYSNSLLDEIIAWPKWIFIESRMYTMLILIFGIGFHVQLEKAKQNNASVVPVFTRRLLGLLILGFIHAILLSTRDILMFYAIAGAVLLLVRNASSRQLLAALVITFLVLITGILYTLFGNVWPQTRALTQPNNYAEHVVYNWQFFKLYHQMYGVYIEMLFHFLLGFWISKAGILKKINENKQFRRYLLIISLAITAVLIPLYYFWAPENFPLVMKKLDTGWQKYLVSRSVGSIWYVLTTACVTLYATTLISISRSVNEKWFKPLTAFGQMALSNYLIQSLVLIPYVLASNKFNNLPPFEGFIVYLVVLSLQLVFSSWWMARYTMGPFEWLLRSFTYWKWQSIRKPVHREFDDEKQLITISI
ncbi:MAG TPA: DUF418 domain-containing protein [Chitinophagaceae bacterium]